MKLTVDVPGFDRTMHEYANYSRKTDQQIVNAKMLQLSFEAQRQTAIAKGLREKLLRYVEANASIWAGFIVKKLNKKGYRRGMWKKAQFSHEARLKHKEIIGAKFRSVGFLRAGYLPAIKKLYPMVKDKSLIKEKVSGAKQYGKDKGSVTPALASDSHPFAEISNTAAGIEKLGLVPLERAAEIIKADMETYIARKHQEEINRFFK